MKKTPENLANNKTLIKHNGTENKHFTVTT